MALTLSNTGIAVSQSILAAQISQSVDAFTNTAAYDISLSGSLKVTGSLIFSSSDGFIKAPGLSEQNVSNVLVYQTSTGNIFYTGSTGLLSPSPISPYVTGSGCDIKPIQGNNTTNGCNFSTISGGTTNHITSSCSYIGGGEKNHIEKTADHSTIIGGISNTVFLAASCSTIIGGCKNQIGTTATNTQKSVILGGTTNNILRCGCQMLIFGEENTTCGGPGSFSTILNGCRNVIGGGSSGCNHSFIAGGISNCINDGANSSILNGCSNRINSDCSTIIGGKQNLILSTHNESYVIGSCITSSASCTVHVNNLVAGCTVQLNSRNPLPSGAAGQLIMSGSGGVCRLYFHNGSAFKEVCLIP